MDTVSTRRSNERSTATIWLMLVVVLLFFIGSGTISYLNTRTLSRNATMVAHTHEVILGLNDLLSLMKDAETGQRGYVITGEDSYLAPYEDALPRIGQRFTELRRLVNDNPEQLARLESIHPSINEKLAELAETIRLRRARGFDAAHAVITTNAGKEAMGEMRERAAEMQDAEQQLRHQRLQETETAYRTAVISGVLSALLGAALSIIVARLLRSAERLRTRELWLQQGEVGVATSVIGDQRVEKLAQQVLAFFAEYTDAHAGAFFVEEQGEFRRVAAHGVAANSTVLERFTRGESLLGHVVKSGKVLTVHDVPEGYLTVGSGLGSGNPRDLIIAPFTADGAVNAVVEMGYIHRPHALTQSLMERVSEAIGVAVRSANYRAELQNLLEETQRQSEELQAQSEELKVNNEELEEQSRALKESQVRMEQQQAEMEQTNSQLEEQAQMLEAQRDELGRARDEVMLKADQLEQASQYKSEFLANMSHELRTPLNSSLILSKLLADNTSGNLTADQVKYAQTIRASGQDLLALINDILDLSKIEAGHMEIHAETVSVKQMLGNLSQLFEPLAAEKKLTLTMKVETSAPATLTTDMMRVEQILKNLLSNAIKFTEKGSVILTVSGNDQETIFAVTDTGIGISVEKQQEVFDAFRQADGNINRKYGGTGLGLSISRELARLLGGHITVTSEPGRGSTFSFTVRTHYSAAAVEPRSHAAPPPKPMTSASPAARTIAVPRPVLTDDREQLAGDKQLILVVEDDLTFSGILYDLVRELGFQCLLAHTAEDALTMIRQYQPQAVILDVGLPDHSGLSVLDRLKHDTKTRHIPVHVVSAGDHASTAMALGAVGYMIKPVKREELTEAMQKLEEHLHQRVRRVLIVEDDAVQRDSMQALLGTRDVQTIAVGSAAECLQKLQETTFDCMVLDLSLPDASGYELLETLSRHEDYPFPPVIVYTGRDLSADDEQMLRRYSKSIIIKGAKSPERLLDEVTLFLHQVVSELPPEQQKMLEKARNRDAMLEGRTVLVVEDDIRNIYALTSILEPHGTVVQIARNGKEALTALEKSERENTPIDLVLMDVMMPEMDGMTATRTIRKQKKWKKLPIIMLTAKAMRDDQERCLDAGANDYMAKPIDVEKLLSLVRVWMPR